jgi:hypothetical protein
METGWRFIFGFCGASAFAKDRMVDMMMGSHSKTGLS